MVIALRRFINYLCDMHRHFIKLILLILLPLATGIDCFSSLKIRPVNGGSYSWLLDQAINCMTQDSDGYLWISTYGGILRYDGAEFILMTHDPKDPFSLADNTVREIKPDPYRGGIWACTGNGLAYFNPEYGKFRHARFIDDDKSINTIKGRINDVLILEDKIICCSSSRMYVSDNAEDPLLFHMSAADFLPLSICDYSEDRFLAANHSGVYMIYKDSLEIAAFAPLISSDYSYSVVYYSSLTDRIYLGNGIGTESAAFRYDGENLHIDDAFVPDDLQRVCDSNGKTYFGTNGNGLYIVNEGEVERITASNGLTSDVVTAFCHDRQNNLWIGLYRGGIMLNQKNMESLTVLKDFKMASSIIPDTDRIYVGTDSYGLGIYNRKTGKTRILNTSNSDMPGNNIVSMSRAGDEIWMAIYTKGLCSYNIRTEEIRSYSLEDHDDLYVDNNKTWIVRHDSKDRIWVGGPSLFIFSKDKGTFTKVEGLDTKFVSAISFKDDIAYISTRHSGIFKIDMNDLGIIDVYDSHTVDGFPENDVRYVHLDTHGTLWFGTQTMGFYSIDESDRSITRYDEGNGLLNNYVTVINEDEKGNLWIGTLNGLHYYSYDSDQFIHLGNQEFIPEQYLYSAGEYDGRHMYFGSTDGLVMFEPKKMEFSQNFGDVVSFTNLTTMSQEPQVYPIYSETPQKIVLKNHDNFFRVAFTVPEYIFHESVRFSCRMNGLERNWRDLGNHGSITFTALKAGEYELEVRCSYMKDRWSAPSSIRICILPKWYATWWAKGLWFLIIAATLILGIKLYLKQQKINEEMRISEIEKKSIREVSEAKLDFFTRIIHDLRTPVFLIRTQIEVLTEKPDASVTVPKIYLDSILRNSRKLTNLVNRLIDFRKLDSNKLGLKLRTCDVTTFCKRLEVDYMELCSRKDIGFRYSCPADPITLTFDPEKLESILNNLISNAFKYTKEGGSIIFKIEEGDSEVRFSVKDNGIGIMPENLEKIFDNFSRTERGMKHGNGDGIGLAVVKAFVELHGGEIRVESQVDKGSDFSFTIPFGLKADESSAAVIDDEAEDTAIKTDSDQISVSNPAAINTVLIVDDDIETLNLMERCLEGSYSILKASDGEEGYRVAQDKIPDLIVCDLDMPGMDGHDFLVKLRNNKKLNNVKFVILTGNNSEDEMMRTYDEGADAYLTKPISLKLLKMRISKLLAQKDNTVIVNEVAESTRNYTREEQIFLLRCREIIDENLTDEDFSMEILADKLAMSHSALYKKIKAITGQSLIGFVNDYKIHRAVLMFRQGEFNVSSVCERCGFKDEKNFRELFKRKTGKTPKQFVMGLNTKNTR